jgi:hypothetical protein
MNALLDLYLATGAERFVAALPPARRWLERSEIRPGVWARLYEPATNRPIYGDRDGSTHYRLDEISQERREEYHWEMRFPSVVRAFARHDAFRAGGIEALREFDSQPAPLSLEERARLADILGTAEDSGRWSVNGAVETQTFVDNCRLILRALAEQP